MFPFRVCLSVSVVQQEQRFPPELKFASPLLETLAKLVAAFAHAWRVLQGVLSLLHLILEHLQTVPRCILQSVETPSADPAHAHSLRLLLILRFAVVPNGDLRSLLLIGQVKRASAFAAPPHHPIHHATFDG